MRKFSKFILSLIVLFAAVAEAIGQRFPKPEFESGYQQAQTQIPSGGPSYFEYIDLAVLFFTLLIATWFVLKKRSRKGIFWISIFSIAYFGFFREGCVCSVGSLQNITLAMFNSGYAIPATVIGFFVLPLIFALFFGRTFCSGVCPLGAIQELVIWKPLKIPPWIEKSLKLIPWIYLGIAILFAATATDFIICRYDPFIGIYRLDGTFLMYIIGAIFLLVGMVIARPYCRFFCPYGVLLNLFSRLSYKHMSITPSECINCRLCENSCPVNAINYPHIPDVKLRSQLSQKLKIQIFLIPVMVVAGIITGYFTYPQLAKANSKVQLAAELISAPIVKEDAKQLEVDAFRLSGTTQQQLYDEVVVIISRFKTGSMILGGILGLIFALTLTGLSSYSYRKDYAPDKGDCLSCARCMDYCPVEKNPDKVDIKS